VLSRVKRQTRAEVEADNRRWASRFNHDDSEEQVEQQYVDLDEGEDDEEMTLPRPEPEEQDADSEDVPWDEWAADAM